jgi:ferric-dicitrate binding protein FerR (iron transport regulator)
MVVQLDQFPRYPFEIYAGDVLCRAHGTLVEVVKRGDLVRVYSHQGAFVASSKGHTEIAKKGQVVSFTGGQFKDKSSISLEDEADMIEWREHLHDIRTGHPHSHP